jgi:hypothetical protein
MVLSLLVAISSVLWAASPPTLQDAIAAYEQLDDAQAVAAFQQILSSNPPREVEAKIHLYLGLIAFNAFRPGVADQEFKTAIRANSALDVPPHTSPKAALAFAQARDEVTRELAEVRAPTAPAQTDASPGTLLVAPPAEAGPPTSHSHVLAFVLGGTAVALGVVAAYGGAQVVSYNSLVNTANNSGETQATAVTSAQPAANFWRFAWIGFAAGGAAALAAGVLTW